jgi:hypothetical protein
LPIFLRVEKFVRQAILPEQKAFTKAGKRKGERPHPREKSVSACVGNGAKPMGGAPVKAHIGLLPACRIEVR